MALTGTTLRSKALSDACGASHTITVLKADKTPANRSALLALERTWRTQTQAQPPDQRHRGQLGVDTTAIAAGLIAQPNPDEYIVAAQDETGTIRGLSLFYFVPTSGVWHLGLHVVQPSDQLGASSACTLRGVGSEMLGADMALMTSRACTVTELEPLDAKAASFWRARGFAPAGDDQWLLTCPGMQGLAAAYAHSPTDDGDMLVMDSVRLTRISLFRYSEAQT